MRLCFAQGGSGAPAMSLLEARLRAPLKTCTRRQLSQVHGLLLTSSLHRLPGLPALLVRRATGVGDMAHGDLLFSSFLRDDRAPPDAALYNAMIRGCAYHGPHERVLELFEEMPRRGLAPDGFTYPHALAAAEVRRGDPLPGPEGGARPRPGRRELAARVLHLRRLGGRRRGGCSKACA